MPVRDANHGVDTGFVLEPEGTPDSVTRPTERLIGSIIAATAMGLIVGIVYLLTGAPLSESAASAGWATLFWIPATFVGTLALDAYEKRMGPRPDAGRPGARGVTVAKRAFWSTLVLTLLLNLVEAAWNPPGAGWDAARIAASILFTASLAGLAVSRIGLLKQRRHQRHRQPG